MGMFDYNLVHLPILTKNSFEMTSFLALTRKKDLIYIKFNNAFKKHKKDDEKKCCNVNESLANEWSTLKNLNDHICAESISFDFDCEMKA